MKPTIAVSSLDMERLEHRLDSLPAAQASTRAALLEELASAELVEPEDMPADVVTMNSRVRYVLDDAPQEFDMSLAYPKDVTGAEDKQSVLTPVGGALPGMKVGETNRLDAPRWRALRSDGARDRRSAGARGRVAPVTTLYWHLPRTMAAARKGSARVPLALKYQSLVLCSDGWCLRASGRRQDGFCACVNLRENAWYWSPLRTWPEGAGFISPRFSASVSRTACLITSSLRRARSDGAGAAGVAAAALPDSCNSIIPARTLILTGTLRAAWPPR